MTNVLICLILMVLLIGLLIVLPIVCAVGIFRKAGRPIWHAFIPLWNLIVMCRVIQETPFIIILNIMFPIGTLIMHYVVTEKTATAFHKGIGFQWGLFFLPFIFYPIVAFDSSVYAFGVKPSLERLPIRAIDVQSPTIGSPSSPILVICPSCNTNLRIDGRMSGRLNVSCPKCKSDFRVSIE